MIVKLLYLDRNARLKLINGALDLSIVQAHIFPDAGRIAEFDHVENLHDHGWIVFLSQEP